MRSTRNLLLKSLKTSLQAFYSVSLQDDLVNWTRVYPQSNVEIVPGTEKVARGMYKYGRYDTSANMTHTCNVHMHIYGQYHLKMAWSH